MERLKKFLDIQVKVGKITKEQADEKIAKHERKNEAKEKYKKDKGKLNKKDLEGLLGILTD
mgnify:CR=1 FL=1